MTFKKIFVIFDCVDIDGTQLTDFILDTKNIFFDRLPVCQLLFSVLKGIVRCDFIFFPHIGNLGFPLLFDFFCLTAQTETLFIKQRCLFREMIPLFEKRLVAGTAFFLFFLPFDTSDIQNLFLTCTFGNGFFEFFNTVFFFMYFFGTSGKIFSDFFGLPVVCFNLIFQTADIFLKEMVLLLQR